MKEELINAKNISFKYLESDRYTLKDINFTIKKGEVVFITGNSGCGKSTLLNIINGIIDEVIEGELSGNLYIDKKENLKIYQRSLLISNVFQNPRSQFFTSNTTSELVFAMENFSVSLSEMKKRVDYIKEKFKIENLLNRDIFSLSSGERQFLALVSAIIMDPNVIIFDEPSANLDYGNAMRLKKEIVKLKEQGKSVIISDHRCFYLDGIIDKVILIENKTLKEFTKDEFFNVDYEKRVFDLFSYPYKKRKIKKANTESVKLKNIYFKDILEDIDVSFNKN